MSCRSTRPCARDHERLLTASWNIIGLLRDLRARGQHPGVIAFAEDGVASWDSATVADKALRLARGLQDAGFGRGSRVAIWAPNSPIWIVAALAVLQRSEERRVGKECRSGWPPYQ